MDLCVISLCVCVINPSITDMCVRQMFFTVIQGRSIGPLFHGRMCFPMGAGCRDLLGFSEREQAFLTHQGQSSLWLEQVLVERKNSATHSLILQRFHVIISSSKGHVLRLVYLQEGS